MRFLYLNLILLLIVNDKGYSQNYTPLINPGLIQKNMISWLTYERDFVHWSSDFFGLNDSGESISKKEFLTILVKGGYLPVRMKTSDNSICYKLYKLNDNTKKEISDVIKHKSEVQLHFYDMKGLPLPDFHFTDLNGNVYNKENTQGKIVVIKGWFVNCIPCINEFPRLNKLVKQYKKKKDVLFISLAFDSKNVLEKFLKEHNFKYNTVPGKEDYLRNGLKIEGYPIHIILDRKGLVQLVTNDMDVMITTLKNMDGKK
ncbi:MAG: TlpA family protein disulfide reductase [Flavobacteriaceae bacterium]|nr:TlpA family protein disulfide reductase [Flavobacteriaceae bacterium]